MLAGGWQVEPGFRFGFPCGETVKRYPVESATCEEVEVDSQVAMAKRAGGGGDDGTIDHPLPHPS
jgi:hypothetical protein